MKHKSSIWWVKRDFRLFDNAALCRALSESKKVVPLYVFEPLVLQGPDWGVSHLQAVHDGVSSLRKNLEHYGQTLCVRQDIVITALEGLHRQIKFTAIYAHEETGLNHTFLRDIAVATWCKEKGIEFIEVQTNGVTRGLTNRDQWQRLFQQAIDESLLPVPKQYLKQSVCQGVPKGRIPALSKFAVTHNPNLRAVTERAALTTLDEFLRVRGHAYSGGISSMNTAPTACSRLSVHLAWGTLSLATIMHKTTKRIQQLKGSTDAADAKWRRSLQKFQSRLYWHSHFVQKLEDQVDMETLPVNRAFTQGLPVVSGVEHEKRLQAWLTGQTGFPSVDAAMRYYQIHGWLTFRSRAMITSFACHALRLPWQTIVYELAKLMHDYVPGIHVSQVQMQAGVTGINTIRVYSPQKQLEDQDPNCHFVQANITELSPYSAADIINHHKEPLAGYIAPIINFKEETKIMKDALYSIKKSPVSKKAAAKVYKKHGSRKRTSRT